MLKGRAALMALLCLGLAGQGKPADAQSDNIVLNILGRWWMPSVSDHMTTNNPAEQPGGSSVFEGQMFYVPSGAIAGTHALYRLYSAPGTDHMDSGLASEGGYTTE